VTSLSTSLDSVHRYDVAEFRRHVYLANGWSAMRRWDGYSSSLTTAGIAGPSQEPNSWTPAPTTGAGSTQAGVHRFRYRYLDSTTGYVSDPSEERDVTVTSSLALTFPISTTGAANIIRSTDSKVDRIVLEATTAGGTVFYQVTTVDQTASSVVCDLSDAALAVSFLPYSGDGHNTPPVARYVVAHRERLWLFGQVVHSEGTIQVWNANKTVTGTGTAWNTEALGTSSSPGSVTWLLEIEGDDEVYEIDYGVSAVGLELKSNYPGANDSGLSYRIYSRANVIWVSRPGYPESFEPVKNLPGPSGQGAGDLTAGVGFGPVMVFFSLSGMHRIAWDQDPYVDPVVTPISGTRGALNQRVVVEVEGRLYAMDRTGVHVWRGVYPEHVSRAVDELWSLIDFSKSDRFHCVWLPEVRAVRWYVCFYGEAYPRHYLQLDADTGAWGTGEHEVGISESRLVPSAAGPVVYLGDENGYVHQADVGCCDGVPDGLSHWTVNVGASTTVIPLNEALPVSGEGLGGVMAYHVESGESRLVTSTTGTSLTVNAFSAAPAEGDRIWLGRILGKLKTRAMGRAALTQVFRPRWVWLAFEPTADARRAKVRYYADYGAEPRTDFSTFSRRNLPGLVHPGNEDVVAGTHTDGYLVETDFEEGMVKVPCGGIFRRTLEVEVLIEEPGVDFELAAFLLDDSEAVQRAAD